MKKFLITVIVLLSIVIVAIWGAAWYVRPSKSLDLKYEEVPIGGMILNMVKLRKPEVQLTEQDVNNLIKKRLEQNKELPHQMSLKGASFELQGERLEADVNVLWDHKVHVGGKLYFQLAWSPPNIEIVHTGTRIKDISLPAEWFQIAPIRIPVEDQLPDRIGINQVSFDPNVIRIGLKLK